MITPRTVKPGQEDKLAWDNVNTRNSWILLSYGHLTICNQRRGEACTGEVRLSRREFNKMVDWYNGVKPKPRKAK